MICPCWRLFYLIVHILSLLTPILNLSHVAFQIFQQHVQILKSEDGDDHNGCVVDNDRDDGGNDGDKPPLYHPKHFFGHHRLILIQSQLPLGPPLHLI